MDMNTVDCTVDKWKTDAASVASRVFQIIVNSSPTVDAVAGIIMDYELHEQEFINPFVKVFLPWMVYAKVLDCKKSIIYVPHSTAADSLTLIQRSKLFSIQPLSQNLSKDRIPTFRAAAMPASLHLTKPYLLLKFRCTREQCLVSFPQTLSVPDHRISARRIENEQGENSLQRLVSSASVYTDVTDDKSYVPPRFNSDSDDDSRLSDDGYQSEESYDLEEKKSASKKKQPRKRIQQILS